jgi:hypothetical protein
MLMGNKKTTTSTKRTEQETVLVGRCCLEQGENCAGSSKAWLEIIMFPCGRNQKTPLCNRNYIIFRLLNYPNLGNLKDARLTASSVAQIGPLLADEFATPVFFLPLRI